MVGYNRVTCRMTLLVLWKAEDHSIGVDEADDMMVSFLLEMLGGKLGCQP